MSHEVEMIALAPAILKALYRSEVLFLESLSLANVLHAERMITEFEKSFLAMSSAKIYLSFFSLGDSTRAEVKTL